jgi:hypothetical protein
MHAQWRERRFDQRQFDERALAYNMHSVPQTARRYYHAEDLVPLQAGHFLCPQAGVAVKSNQSAISRCPRCSFPVSCCSHKPCEIGGL